VTALADQPWLTASATRAVMSALEAAGGAGCARFVGGCVRNALLNQPIDDIDIATTLRPEETDRAIRVAGLKAVPTGMAHGTVTAISERTPFEITTLRRDVSTDGRNATVAFTDDWAEDAARRDFRLNAVYADGHGAIFDPTGQGVADALAGRIIFVGEAETRVREDYLRILRFFRFFAWYGRGAPDATAMQACAALASGMTRLSMERVSKELLKLLAAPEPLEAVEAMQTAGVLDIVLPERGGMARFSVLAGQSGDAGLRLMALLPSDPDVLRAMSVRLRLSNAVRDRMTAAARAFASVNLGMSDAEARAVLYRHGASAFEDAVRLRGAEAVGREAEAQRLMAVRQTWTIPVLPVNGRDLARLGVEQGPDTGRILKAFEADWIAADFPADGHEARLKSLITPPRG
jgi:poly(A) polymerase